MFNQPLIHTNVVASLLEDPSVKLVDASWQMPNANRNAAVEFKVSHLPGAVFFDLDDISDPDSPYPHMLPSTKRFEEKISALGIGNDDKIVVYDTIGLFSAPRAWWMFRVFGHEQVAVMSGGLPKWKAENRPLKIGPEVPEPSQYRARFRPELVRTIKQVQENVSSQKEQLVDARSRDRFYSRAPEPRAGLRSGSIPGSYNVPWMTLVENGQLLHKRLIADIFEEAAVKLNQPIAATCGSGVSACILALALSEAGVKDVPVYDGSWAEWGMAMPPETR